MPKQKNKNKTYLFIDESDDPVFYSNSNSKKLRKRDVGLGNFIGTNHPRGNIKM